MSHLKERKMLCNDRHIECDMNRIEIGLMKLYFTITNRCNQEQFTLHVDESLDLLPCNYEESECRMNFL